jgi:hypothetical protein
VNIQFTLANHGYEVRRQACPADTLAALQAAFPLDCAVDWELAEHSPLVQELLRQGFLRDLAVSVLGPECFATHAILYNKTAGNNTAQAWHQDTTIKVAGSGFVEAPEEGVFARLLSIRLSLDDCSFFDGALKLCPSSYKHGRLTELEVRRHSLRPFSSPEMQAGDVLLMHPLTIHASGASESLKPRRVIHAVYASGAAGASVEWAARY